MPDGTERIRLGWSPGCRLSLVAALVVVIGAITYLFRPLPPPYLNTEILVLGDSQLSFGAGPVFRDFFKDLPAQCSAHVPSSDDLARLAGKRFAMIGTRSTSLESWVTSSGRPWELLCHKDKRWGVNASTWGTVKPAKKRYVQIGEGAPFQFCRNTSTPLEQLFAAGYYAPQLLMIFVGGNGAERLALDKSAADADVARLVERLPAQTGCVFMMTAPIFSKSHNDARKLAQANLRAAFAKLDQRCTFVEGHTPQTRTAIEGHKEYFRRNEAGDVKDPYHANKAAASQFLALRRDSLCVALAAQFKRRSAQ